MIDSEKLIDFLFNTVANGLEHFYFIDTDKLSELFKPHHQLLTAQLSLNAQGYPTGFFAASFITDSSRLGVLFCDFYKVNPYVGWYLFR